MSDCFQGFRIDEVIHMFFFQRVLGTHMVELLSETVIMIWGKYPP